MALELPTPVAGQFDDADEDAHIERDVSALRIDSTEARLEQELLAWSEDSEDEDDPKGYAYEDELEFKVDDEDWEISERGM